MRGGRGLNVTITLDFITQNQEDGPVSPLGKKISSEYPGAQLRKKV